MSKGEQTRQRIIEEAARVFNERGFEGASMSALMEATGLEKGGIYRHFSGKEELAAAAFDYAWREAVNARTQDLESISNSIAKLKQSIANFVERRAPVPGGCPLLNTAIDADDGNATLRKCAQEALREWRERLIGIIEAGVRRKEIGSGVNPETVATLLISSLEGALMMSRLERDSSALASVRESLEKYLDEEVAAQRKISHAGGRRKRRVLKSS
jgi:AcrR family transcriptional regulator